jgi:acetyl-CoA carboxylase biotin carboxylase subunit
VPVVPGTADTLQNETDALDAADEIGYPIMVKATAGGGGKGMRIVHSEEELLSSVKLAQNEAAAAFGNPAVYMERYISEPRHIEIQVMADKHGNVCHLGERDCSVQTPRHQKMVEEAPSAALTPDIRQAMGDAAVKAAQAVKYEGAGTIEFLLDGGQFYFMEMNTRIQVEHPVTEMVTGIDLVKEQIRVAYGDRLSFKQSDIKMNGHAIEVRLTAEDPERNLAPSVGKITHLVLPGGYGVRVDTHVYAGYSVPPYYDSLLAKIIAWAPTRAEAIARMSRCLAETQVEGIQTTVSFHRRLMRDEVFQRGEATTGFVKKRMLDP